ncbi:hypothetical protein GSI_00968 [Ganoderma sinense ZZ0214-1]|uniref:Uncharacterized protein n=1 Tax=Ganoderma sinense ZZ0214-1 TaxID=1077348 RepID=A0A2G8SU28_9APHY|nr:hypothetical protein GSI_00968 [Ganoderma sinense ZZ0214-1]
MIRRPREDDCSPTTGLRGRRGTVERQGGVVTGRSRMGSLFIHVVKSTGVSVIQWAAAYHHLLPPAYLESVPQEDGANQCPRFPTCVYYDEVLGDGWEKVLDEVPKISMESHIGKERIVVRRKL